MRLPCLRRAFCTVMWTVVSMVLLPDFCLAQSVADLQRLTTPQHLEFSPDSSRLWYKLGANWWRIDTAPNSQPERDSHHQSQEASNMPQISSRPSRLRCANVSEWKLERVPATRSTLTARNFYLLRASRSRPGQSEATASVPDADSVAFQWASNSSSGQVDRG